MNARSGRIADRAAWLRQPAAARRIAAMLGGFILILLVPLPFLGDLRVEHRPYLFLVSLATLALYLGALLLARIGARPGRGLVLGVALLLRLAMLPMLPTLSDDAWRYLWDGRLLLHGVNPYLAPPAASPPAFHDELLERQGYPTTNTIYPPAAQLLFASSMAMGEMVGRDPIAGYIALKLVLIAAEMVGIVLLLGMMELRGLPLAGAILYAWHPLAVTELAGSGHTDALWVLSLALALHGFARRGGLPGLALGGATRLYPLGLAPLWARYLGWRDTLRGLLLSIPFLLLFLPLLDPAALRNYGEVLVRFTNFYEFNGGFYYGVKWALDYYHIKPSNVITGRISGGLQLALLLAVWLWPLRARSLASLAGRALVAVTAQIVLGAKVHVWYFVAPLFLLPLADRSPLRRAWLWAALVGPFTYLIYAGDPPAERYDVVIVEWGGFLLIALYDSLRAWRKRTPSTPELEMDGVRESTSRP